MDSIIEDQQCFNCYQYFTKKDIQHHEDLCYSKRISTKKKLNNEFSPFSPKEGLTEVDSHRNASDESAYMNLNDAAMTFGGRHTTTNESRRDPEYEENRRYNSNINAKEFNSSIKKNNFLNQNPFSLKNNNNDNRVSLKESLSIENNQNKENLVLFKNSVGDFNDYVIVIIHSLWNMKTLRNFILNIDQRELRQYKTLVYLKSLLEDYSKNVKGRLDVSKLKQSLAADFNSRRKFVLNTPDCPVDLFFSLINYLHSFYLVRFINLFRKEMFLK